MDSNKQNISWDIEEEVLLMDLFIQIQASTDKEYIQNKILELSKYLNYRAKILNFKVTDTFRNPNGIRMKLQNLNYVMSNGQRGLSTVSAMDKKVCSLYNNNRGAYDKVLLKSKSKYCHYITDNGEKNGLMEVFKNWLKEQNISKQEVESIVNVLNKIKHDFDKKKEYQYLFIDTDTKDVMKNIRILKNDKLYIIKNHMSKNSYSRSLDMYLEFIKYNKKCSKKGGKTNNIRLVQYNENFLQSSSEIKYKKVLKEYFTNGFRLNSYLELKKFKIRYYEAIENKIEDDDKIIDKIKKIGIEHDGKIYLEEQMMDCSTATSLMIYIQNLFNEGKKTIFYDSLYRKFKDDFQGYCMYNEEMLKSYLSYVNDGNYYMKRSYISSNENDNIEPIDEICECMIENGGIYSYDELAELLPHVPIEKIKIILGANSEFVRNQKGCYFHANIIDLTDEELKNIGDIIQNSINDKGYASGRELCIEIKEACLSAYEKMTELSEIGIRDVIAYKLREQFSCNGNIISKIGESISATDIYVQYSKGREKFTLNDLYELRDEIGSSVIYFEPIYLNSLRISEMEFVSKKYAQFDVSTIDKIIDKFCVGDYVPIAEITQFSLFPTEKFRWNSYLLEHYIYSYSYQYMLLNRGFNANKCIGVIIKRTSQFKEYEDVLVDAIANSCISLNSEEALDYLYNNGYIGRRSVSDIDKIIANAKKIRIEKGQ